MSQEMLHLFYIRSGFEYFFSTVLIEHLGLKRVVFVLSEPREGIEKRAAEDYSVIYTKGGFVARTFGKKAGKLAFARRVFKELDLAGKRVALYSPAFNETFLDALRSQMDRKCAETRYVLLPDGAALLRHLPRKEENPYAFIKLVRKLYGVEPVDHRHTSGSYSNFIDKIYHYPAKKISMQMPRRSKSCPFRPPTIDIATKFSSSVASRASRRNSSTKRGGSRTARSCDIECIPETEVAKSSFSSRARIGRNWRSTAPSKNIYSNIPTVWCSVPTRRL